MSLSRRWILNISVVILMVFIAVLAGAFSLDKSISNKWSDYSYGNLEQRLTGMNLPLEHKSMMIFNSRETGKLVPLENYYETCHFDDIGYMLMGQLIVKATGKEMDGDRLARIHNLLFVLGILMISIELIWIFGSYSTGVIVFSLLLTLQNGIKAMIYSSVSQHTLLSVLPVLFIAILLPLVKLRKSSGIWFYLTILTCGLSSGIFFLVRNPFGKASMIVLILLIIFSNCRKQWRRAVSGLIILITGFFTVVVGLTGCLAYMRDKQQGWAERGVADYLKMPSSHTTYYTLMAAIGRYKNPLDLEYNDGILDRYLLRRMEEDKVIKNRSEYKFLFDKFAKQEFFRYVKNNTDQYFKYFIKGNLEMIWVVPALTFQHGRIFYGVPESDSRKIDQIDKRDIIPPLNNGLLNLKFDYLRISWFQWLLYIASLVVLVLLVIKIPSWFSGFDKEQNHVYLFISLILMGGALYVPRALVPVWGQDFVVFYWLCVVISSAYLMRKIDIDSFVVNLSDRLSDRSKGKGE